MLKVFAVVSSTRLSAADPFSAPDMTRDRPNEDPFARVATITVAIVGVGGSAVAGTAFALYKEVSRIFNIHSQQCSSCLRLSTSFLLWNDASQTVSPSLIKLVCGLQNLVGLVIWWIILFGASALFVVQYQNGLKRELREKERR